MSTLATISAAPRIVDRVLAVPGARGQTSMYCDERPRHSEDVPILPEAMTMVNRCRNLLMLGLLMA